MSIKIIPITALRDTQKLEEEVLSSDSPIHITKNGYSSMVIMSEEAYGEGRRESCLSNVSYHGKVDAELDDPLGFVRVKAAAFPIHLADPQSNVGEMKKQIDEAISEGVSVLCFSELCLTGYTAGDLFLDSTLLDGALSGLKELVDYSSSRNIAFCVGLPLQIAHKIYNVAALVSNGKLVGIVPKRFIPTYQEFYEGRYFKGYEGDNGYLDLFGERIPFGNRLIFSPSSYPSLKIGIEICEDLWVPNSPSQELSLSGANLILNLSASNETVGKAAYRRDLVGMQSAKLISAYLYCDAGEGESTTDCVYSAHNIIAENGAILSESKPFAFHSAIAEIDIDKLNAEKRKTNSFDVSSCPSVYFPLRLSTPKNIKRHYARNPFIPEEKEIDLARVNEVMDMQIAGLVGRLKAIRCHKVVVGLSGGLDSTLALLVAVEAFKKIGYSLSDITAITLPCFGTSKRTHDNAEELSKDLGVSFKEISIANTVKSHLNDIGHPLDNLNVAYENAQARERTQVERPSQGKDSGPHGCRQRHRCLDDWHRRPQRALPRLVHVWRGSHVHVWGQRLDTQDLGPLSLPWLRYNAPDGLQAFDGHNKHPDFAGAAANQKRRDRPEDRGHDRAIRAPRFLHLPLPAFPLLPEEAVLHRLPRL